MLLHECVLLLERLICGLLLPNVGHRGRDLLFGVGEFGVTVVGRLALSCVGTIHACAKPVGDLCDSLLDLEFRGPPLERLRQGCPFCRG